ncbi:MAG: glycosyltransferase family 4 protein, partial [Candidatus Gastranaerophilales bacterium]|nr:glycosyltransferase family 4 protein [Candidatus Gastranaerophilales bacterium]
LITIYARKGYVDSDMDFHKGIKIKPLKTFKNKHLEASFHTFWALLHAIFSDADIIHFHAQGPCLFAWMPRLLAPKKKLVFTCHGLDWQRNKWNKFAQKMIFAGEISSAKFFDMQIMVSKDLDNYYKNTYGINSIKIQNGTEIGEFKQANIIKEKFNLSQKNYILFVGRLVPEKAPHLLIDTFKKVKTSKKLVLTGASSSTDEYFEYLQKIAQNDSRIIFTGYQYGEILQELYSNAYLYVTPSELEGLPLTLLEAMSYGLPVLASDISPHKEVIENEKYGYLFKKSEMKHLAEKLELLLNTSDKELRQKGMLAKNFTEKNFNWDLCVKKTLNLYRVLMNS